MSKSIRVTHIRTDLGVAWPWEQFPADAVAGFNAWKTAFPGNPSYISADVDESLTAVIDHIITNDADLETHRTAMMALLPWWKNATNAAAVDAYMAANNLTFSITEINAPDTSGLIDITNNEIWFEGYYQP